MEVNLLVGGPIVDISKNVLEEKKDKFWVGADYGAVRLCKFGIKPKLAIGDFDSTSTFEKILVKKMSLKTVIASPIKDKTDTELAIIQIFKEFENIEKLKIYGATGGRIDHLLANLLFILKAEFKPLASKIEMVDKFNTLTFYLPGEHEIKKEKDKKYLAFVPLGFVKGLELIDEKYTLEETDFNYPKALSSNEFVGDKAHFKFKSGFVLVIQSKD